MNDKTSVYLYFLGAEETDQTSQTNGKVFFSSSGL